jgi:hypothetical protein
MNWNDYEAVWKRQEPPVGETADLAGLRTTLEARSRKLHGVLLVRDFGEAGAGLLVAAALAFAWWRLGRTAWPMALAIGLLLGISAFFIRERFRARRLRPDADAPMLAKVEADLSLLRRQCRLVRTLWAWYLGPCAAAVALTVGVIVRREPKWSPLRDPALLAGLGFLFALVFWFGWELNRRALRRRLEPRLAELEKLRRDILSTL